MRIVIFAVAAVLVAGFVLLSMNMSGFSAWAVEQQRAFQNAMAGAVRALQAGEDGALLALFAATGAYGFVHALGPGHGKYLVGGVGLGSSISAVRLASVAIASSLTQSLWAIVIVYGGFSLIAISAQQMTFLAEDIFAPASYLAIGAVGGYLLWRGIRSMPKRAKDTQTACATHGHDDCGCHGHGPTPEEVSKIGSLRDAVVLISSIAIRPCTGAIFLLVIAWQMDIRMAGAMAVIVMGLGTAALTTTVALSSVAARRVAMATATPSLGLTAALSATQIAMGLLIMLVSFGLLRTVL